MPWPIAGPGEAPMSTDLSTRVSAEANHIAQLRTIADFSGAGHPKKSQEQT